MRRNVATPTPQRARLLSDDSARSSRCARSSPRPSFGSDSRLSRFKWASWMVLRCAANAASCGAADASASPPPLLAAGMALTTTSHAAAGGAVTLELECGVPARCARVGSWRRGGQLAPARAVLWSLPNDLGLEGTGPQPVNSQPCKHVHAPGGARSGGTVPPNTWGAARVSILFDNTSVWSSTETEWGLALRVYMRARGGRGEGPPAAAARGAQAGVTAAWGCSAPAARTRRRLESTPRRPRCPSPNCSSAHSRAARAHKWWAHAHATASHVAARPPPTHSARLTVRGSEAAYATAAPSKKPTQP